MRTPEKASEGQGVIQSIGLLFVTLLVGAFSIDAGLYFAAHRGMQNAADAAALAAVSELFRDTSSSPDERMLAAKDTAMDLSEQNMGNMLNDSDIEFGYVDPQSGVYDSSSFTTPTNDSAFDPTGGYNSVRVVVRAGAGQANGQIPAIFSKFLGFEGFNADAQAVAIYGGGVSSASGLRPVYMCQAAWDEAQEDYGDATIPEITFYGDTLKVGSTTIDASGSCGDLGPGNWGLADLRSCSGEEGDEDDDDDDDNGNGNGNNDDDDDNDNDDDDDDDNNGNDAGAAAGGNGNGNNDDNSDDNGNGNGNGNNDDDDDDNDNGNGNGNNDDDDDDNGNGNNDDEDDDDDNDNDDEEDDDDGSGSCGGAPGAATVKDWFENGYDGEVSVGEDYGSQPGNSIHAYESELNDLKNNETVINVPLYSSTSGNGSNATYAVSQIASFVITDFQTTGSQSERYIKGYFRKSICHSNCSLGNPPIGGGTTKIRLVH